MAVEAQLETAVGCIEIQVTNEDWLNLDADVLLRAHGQLLLIRTFEEQILELASQGLVHGPAHSSIGQEGAAVASAMLLRSTDKITGSHRGHHQFLAKSLNHAAPGGIRALDEYPASAVQVLRRTLAEICGLADGFCGGRGGSMHLQWIEAGAMGTNAIVGGGVPSALGFAYNARRAGTDDISVAYFGDGATNIGSVLESFNLAAAWNLPVCFFIENNQYAIATSLEESTREPRLALRGPAFGIPSWRADGMDVVATREAMSQAVKRMRSTGGPTLVEVDTYRYFHQNGPMAGSAFGYRTKQEERTWRDRDPLAQLVRVLQERDILTLEHCQEAELRAKQLMVQLVDDYAPADKNASPPKRAILDSAWPDPQNVDANVRGDLAELSGFRFREAHEFEGPVEDRKFIEVISETMQRHMSLHPETIVFGEDIHKLNGGTNGATRGIIEKFPDRIHGTPISENAFTGMALGMAIDGRTRPVFEYMYADFMWVAGDQIFNQIGKARHMFGGNSTIPLVLRTKAALGGGYASQHSMDPAGVFSMSPGWRIAAPTTPYDYIGMMNTALACDDPVLMLENLDLYSSIGPVPRGDWEYFIEPGKAAVRRTGSDVTIITYLGMVAYALEAAEGTDEVDCEVIDLRWLDRASVDWETIGRSIKKTNQVIVAEQGPTGPAYGAWIADQIQRRYFDYLDRPVLRVTGGEASPTASKVLEQAAVARRREVELAIAALVEA